MELILAFSWLRVCVLWVCWAHTDLLGDWFPLRIQYDHPLPNCSYCTDNILSNSLRIPRICNILPQTLGRRSRLARKGARVHKCGVSL
jgi:hypothetical protein